MKSIELFAGAGGLGIGLHQAGFHPLGVVEKNNYCRSTILENQERGVEAVKGWKLLDEPDVREVQFERYKGRISLVSGGPPCQPFSLGGKHGAYRDDRDLFPQAIRAIREARPKAFIFENVKGLTRDSFRNYFEYIRLQLSYPEIIRKDKEDESWEDHLARLEQHHTSARRSSPAYRVVTQVLDAADYGVPQRRHRVLIVGFREDLGIAWSFPNEKPYSRDALNWDQVHGDYWDRHEVSKKHRKLDHVLNRVGSKEERPDSKPWRTVRDAISDLPDPEKYNYREGPILNHRFQPGARAYVGHTGSPLDEPAKALKAGVHGVPGGENMLRYPDGRVRYFTVRESARLQTFPDDFFFHGCWSETMRQLGNAVPVTLAQVVGEHVAKQLGKS